MELDTPLGLSSGDGTTRKRRIPCRRELLISTLQRFYNSRTDLDRLIPIVKGEGHLSLRVIDWFVTNYAKKHLVSYPLPRASNPELKEEFVVYRDYKNQLKAFSKKLFDPFCRRERILFSCGSHEPFVTTVGQLNFFMWAFEKKILEYMETHLEDIQREEKQARTNGTQSSVDSTGSTSTIATAASDASTLTAASSVSLTDSIATKTRRRRTEKVVSSTKLMHKHEFQVEISFD